MTPDGRWQVTGIGSLGHDDAVAAVTDVLALRLDLPFWPQLPRRGAAETMVVQAAVATGLLHPLDPRGNGWRLRPHAPTTVADAVLRGDSRGFAPQAAGFDAFVAASAGRRWPHVKGQWIGPATLLAAVALDGAIALREQRAEAQAVLDALHLGVLAQTQALLAVADRVDLWLDEPLLATLETPGTFEIGAARSWYARLAHACGPRVRLGVHDCAGVDPLLFELDVPVVSIDASAGIGAEGQRSLARHLRRGWVAWGAVPTSAEADASTVLAAIRGSTDRLDVDSGTLAHRSLLTPACGLASLGAKMGIERLAMAQSIAATLRDPQP